jgi:hypothetical protein
VGGFVAYPVEKPIDRFGSTTDNRNFVNLGGRREGLPPDRFPAIFTPISSVAAVIRGGTEAPLATTRGGVA